MNTKEKTKSNEPMEPTVRKNFIKEIIDIDIAAGKNQSRVATRFPPEPNGYLHIGHAKSICLNFGLAAEYKGTCNLRFDDTNPAKEEVEYVESIKEDVRWLGFDWEDRLYFASDYFEQMYEHAITLIKAGGAYIESLSLEKIREYRGDFNRPGENSPDRDRPIEENLALFKKMRGGDFADGEICLRAKIDMRSPNMNLRDPIIYRIRHAEHHRTGNTWCIYPMYDWAHGLEDSIENITHSICTLEFENHRPLYDWFLDQLPVHHPQQIEFARLNLSYTVMSKRKLLDLVEGGRVSGWDDPRMPTISGLRRRGYTPQAIRNFCDQLGVAKRDGVVDIALLEHTLRDDLNNRAPRVMAVLNPLKIVIENYPKDEEEWFEAPLHPEDESLGTRKIPFSRELYIERDDFREDAPKKWFRLSPGKEIRLRYACIIKCTEVIKDSAGEVIELRCTWDPKSRGGTSPDGRKIKGTSHWVSAKHALGAEVRLYDRLFTLENPLKTEDGKHFADNINPDSLSVLTNCMVEPSLKNAAPEQVFQFERLGYFVADRHDFSSERLTFNRSVTLRDSWAKIEKNLKPEQTKKNNKQQNKPKTDPNAKTEAGGDFINIDDFAKLDLRVGLVKEASIVKDANKLLCLKVDIGEGKPRQIFSGIRAHYNEPEKLVGTNVIVVANLKPRKMRFGISEGMVLAGAGPDDSRLTVATFLGDIKPGDTVS